MTQRRREARLTEDGWPALRNGKGGELIKAADGSWRMKGDDGTKFEKLTSSSNGNGDDNGEYWKVATTDGTQYFFGLNRLPNWTSGKPETGPGLDVARVRRRSVGTGRRTRHTQGDAGVRARLPATKVRWHGSDQW
ncbi:hypothetical protein GCM10023088_10050 [Actinomadura verrucosospora]|uniref:hypothetical protein n=1 Tax=Actinomadura verrucosospora TaxID=46165 RepID=UPI0031EF4634